MASILAHIAPELTPTDAGELAMTIIFVLALVVPFIVLGVVMRVFWRAAKRDELESQAAPPIEPGPAEWRNAPSS